MSPSIVYTYHNTDQIDLSQYRTSPNIVSYLQGITIEPFKFTTKDSKYPLPCRHTQVVHGEPTLLDEFSTVTRIYKFIKFKVLNDDPNTYAWQRADIKAKIANFISTSVTAAKTNAIGQLIHVDEIDVRNYGAQITATAEIKDRVIYLYVKVDLYNSSDI